MKRFVAVHLLVVAVLAVTGAAEDAVPVKIGFHNAVYDVSGRLAPWTPLRDAIEREMAFYLKCPRDQHGYPVFAYTTFMDGEYKVSRMDTIPCTQNGMGILSYLKYWEYTGKTRNDVLDVARKMGDYLVNETLTPN